MRLLLSQNVILTLLFCYLVFTFPTTALFSHQGHSILNSINVFTEKEKLSILNTINVFRKKENFQC